MIRRSVYESIGGHSTIRNRLVEDAAIAQLAKSKGYRLRLMIGDGLASTDWESDFKAVYHGMERVFSDSIRSYGLVSLLDAVLVFFLGLYPLLFLAGLAIYSSSLPHSLSLVYPSSSSSPLLILLLDAGLIASVVSLLLALSVCANELSLVKENRKVELFFAPFLYPIGTCLFIGAIITSTIKISRSRGFEWKGQKYEQKLAIRNR